MENLNPEIKNKILNFLRSKKLGASSNEIARNIKHNRITVTKYLGILKANDYLTCEGFAQAKLWRISDKKDTPLVLVVDDEPNVVDLISLSLTPEKYSVIKAYSGLDAIDRAYQEVPDLIILDIMMPGVDGYEVCRRLKRSSITRHIPIIMLSAKGELDDKLKGLKIGADDYMAKPFDPMELEARVAAHLRRSGNDIDTNPLTHLPGIEGIKAEIVKRKDDLLLKVQLQNTDEYKSKFGFRKYEDTVLLVSRMLQDVIGDGYIAHTLDDAFFVLTSDHDVMGRIRDGFKKLLPYIYHDGDDKTPLSVRCRKVRGLE